MPKWPIILWLVGLYITTGITALLWDTRRYTRILPVVYGLCSGFLLTVFALQESDPHKILIGVLSGGAVGLVMTFILWIEGRPWRKHRK